MSVVTPFDSRLPNLDTLKRLNNHVNVTLLMTSTYDPLIENLNRCFIIASEVKNTMSASTYVTEFYASIIETSRLHC